MSTFDHFSLQPSDAADLKKIAKRLRYLLHRATSLIIEIGNHLKAAKARLGHGEFGKFCLSEAGIEIRTAENYLALSNSADAYPPLEIAELPTRTAYQLAAKGTPVAVVEEFMSEVRAGRVPNFDDVRRRITATKGNRASTSHPDVDDLANRLLEVLDVLDVSNIERFLRARTKA